MNLNDSIRLTDDLERQLIREATTFSGPDLKLIPALKSGIAALGKLLGGVLNFIGNLNESMNRARARSTKYAGSEW